MASFFSAIDCSSSQYQNWTYFALGMCAIYPIGIPTLYLVNLYKNRGALNPTVTMHEVAASKRRIEGGVK